MAKTIRSANNSLPCSGHWSLLANGVCACHHGYLDTHCNIDSCQVLTTCSGHSTCEAGLCRCDVGWQPPSCTIDTCPGHFPAGAALGCHALQGHGQCVQGVCVCAAGFKGGSVRGGYLPKSLFRSRRVPQRQMRVRKGLGRPWMRGNCLSRRLQRPRQVRDRRPLRMRGRLDGSRL